MHGWEVQAAGSIKILYKELGVLSDFIFTFHFHALEKAVATHSSVLAWRTPWIEEPAGLRSVGSQRITKDTTEVT